MKASNSRIQCYKSCRRMYWLKYVEGLEPVQKTEALETGLSYHEKVEQLLKGVPLADVVDGDAKTDAMAKAFSMYILPELNATATEEWFEYGVDDGENSVIGRIDARDADGCVIEHKTTSADVDGSYWAGLEFNEQIMTYMLACGTNRIKYTVCKKPTIRQKSGETDEEFYDRCWQWFQFDTDHKIGMMLIERTQEQLDEFKAIQAATVKEMAECKLFYRNEGQCMKWGRMCEYAPICGSYDPNAEYIEFQKGGKKS